MARIRSQKSATGDKTKDVSLLGASSNIQEKTALLNDLIDLKVIIPSSAQFSEGVSLGLGFIIISQLQLLDILSFESTLF